MLHNIFENVYRREEEAKSIRVQTFARWCNAQLGKQHQKVEDLGVDLRDGTKLLALLEILAKKTFVQVNIKPKYKAQYVENIDTALQFINHKIRQVDVGKFYSNRYNIELLL